jgi:hypothetical protein
MLTPQLHRADHINDEIVVEDLPTCAQAMVKWNGAGTSKIACNWKLKKREGYENPALLHTACNGMVARHVTMHG